jgi:hypothetical protein
VKTLIFSVLIFISCGVKKDIECTPIPTPIPKTEKVIKDTIKKDSVILKKAAPIQQTPATKPSQKTYKYMKRIIHRNNPVA